MELFFVIGNLGADAKLVTENGKEFISFNVAETRKWSTADGKDHEETIWNSCIMNGRQEKLLPYLTKGTKVFVMGRGSARVFSSPKLKAMVAGLNISVDRLELISVNREVIPARLVSPNGVIVNVNKAYYIDPNIAKTENGDNYNSIWYNEHGIACAQVDKNGWCFPIANNSQNATDGTAQDATKDATPCASQDATPDSEQETEIF